MSPGPLAVGRDGGAPEKEMDGDGREDEEANVRGGVGESRKGSTRDGTGPPAPSAPRWSLPACRAVAKRTRSAYRRAPRPRPGRRRARRAKEASPGRVAARRARTRSARRRRARREGGDARAFICDDAGAGAVAVPEVRPNIDSRYASARSARSSARPPSAADRETRRRASVISPRAGPCDEGTLQMIEPNDTRECGVLRGRRHKNLFHVQRYPLHDARDVPRAIRPGGGAARFSASLLARVSSWLDPRSPRDVVDAHRRRGGQAQEPGAL